MNAEDTKKAEFARLFDLCERLASRRSRAANEDSSSTPIDDMPTLPVPAGLTPVFTSLATLVGSRKPCNAIGKKSDGRARRSTVANGGSQGSGVGLDVDDDDDKLLANFPLEKEYPFTFKMMLHKLYQLDDWKMKVKEVLERSQIDYKPLAEQELLTKESSQGAKAEEKAKNLSTEENTRAVCFKVGVAVIGGGRIVGGRPRSHSVAGFGKSKEVGLVPISPKARASEHSDDVRAVKKRCVRRRKSINGPLDVATGKTASNWVYNAAVSAAEVHQCQPTVNFTAAAMAQSWARSRYQSLGSTGRPCAIKRRTSSGAPSTAAIEWTAPFQPLANGSGKVVSRRRAMTVADITAPNMDQRKIMKRPFAS